MLTIADIRNGIKSIPKGPGVYLFFDDAGTVVYIGKSNNLANRVRSYLMSGSLVGKTKTMMERVSSVDFVLVGSEFEALLLESRLINKFKPKFNIVSRDDKSPLYVVFTAEFFPRIRLMRKKDIFKKNGGVFGPFNSTASARSILKRVRKIFHFCESKGDKGKPCFYSYIGLCDPCPRTILKSARRDLHVRKYKTNLKNIKKIFGGNLTGVRKILFSDMKIASESLNFEDAARIRDQVLRLEWLFFKSHSTDEYLENPNLIEDQGVMAVESLKQSLELTRPPRRVEVYDVSRTGREFATAAMVVGINGILDRSSYRHFRVKYSKGTGDEKALGETIARRLNHPEWGWPDLIVVDGGRGQLGWASKVIKEAGASDISVIALAKRLEEIYVPSGEILKLPLEDTGLKFLILLRNEAHRFSRRLHHKLRSLHVFS